MSTGRHHRAGIATQKSSNTVKSQGKLFQAVFISLRTWFWEGKFKTRSRNMSTWR